MSKTLRRALVAVVAVLTSGFAMIGGPADVIHADDQRCSAITAKNGLWTNGSQRTLLHQHTIRWSFANPNGCTVQFPTGGNISLNVQYLNCSTGAVTGNSGRYPQFTAASPEVFDNTLTPSIPANTCYRVRWYGNNSASHNQVFQGRLYFTA